MINDVVHQHDDTTQGNMALVKSYLSLYTTFMTSEDDTEAFYGTFNAMADTIDFHGGSDRYHPLIYADHITLLCVDRELFTRAMDIDCVLSTQRRVI